MMKNPNELYQARASNSRRYDELLQDFNVAT